MLVCNAEEARLLTEQASLHGALDAIGAVIRARDHASAMCVTDGAGGEYLMTIAGALLVASYPTSVVDPTGADETFAGALMAAHLAGAGLAQAMVTGTAASLAVEGIGPNRLFAATPCEMQRRAAVIAAMTETACRHG